MAEHDYANLAAELRECWSTQKTANRRDYYVAIFANEIPTILAALDLAAKVGPVLATEYTRHCAAMDDAKDDAACEIADAKATAVSQAADKLGVDVHVEAERMCVEGYRKEASDAE